MVSTDKPSGLPGLKAALEVRDFHKCGALYNTLLDDSEQPPIADKHIANLAEIFVRNDAEKVFGIHLIHGHFKIPQGTVILGTNFKDPSLRWARVTSIDKVDPLRVHGHIFALTKDGLCAYELQDGPLPDLSGVRPQFLDSFINYLVKNDLTSVIGLQVLGCSNCSMSELILDQGTVMLDSSCVKNPVLSRITGWKFEEVGGIPRACKPKELHLKNVDGAHQVYRRGEPIPKLENIDDLKAALSEAGVIYLLEDWIWLFLLFQHFLAFVNC
ncbi:uncharacterized protein GIQ15_05560 [Arthroderma uncinatum]|uniref:uncharacterized protein n=1 Tax=Arthroderma uncinatum TaxID=74035 RepID=UPI00144AA7F5|nr:uncharacterized protein GIQ15_05560 [Arthroderma uncinatum]KAF3480213.1 hypothetical protein GIQ15_05560 [Arthroderma uncinatum]